MTTGKQTIVRIHKEHVNPARIVICGKVHMCYIDLDAKTQDPDSVVHWMIRSLCKEHLHVGPFTMKAEVRS